MTNARVCTALALAIGLVLAGCKKSGPAESAAPSAGAAAADQASGPEREARDAAMADLQKHWTHGPDGWTTAITSGVSVAPDHYLRQLRELAIDRVDRSELDDSDRLNGIEWAGQVAIKQSPCREAGDNGVFLEGLSNAGLLMRQHGRWTQWADFQPEALRVQKVKGQWQVHQDTLLLRGSLPTPRDYAAAGVR